MSQVDTLLKLLQDGKPHSTVEIQKVVYGGDHLGTARIASRVTDLRNRGYVVESLPGKVNKSVWWYKLVSSPEKPKERRMVVVQLFDENKRPNGVRIEYEYL